MWLMRNSSDQIICIQSLFNNRMSNIWAHISPSASVNQEPPWDVTTSFKLIPEQCGALALAFLFALLSPSPLHHTAALFAQTMLLVCSVPHSQGARTLLEKSDGTNPLSTWQIQPHGTACPGNPHAEQEMCSGQWLSKDPQAPTQTRAFTTARWLQFSLTQEALLAAYNVAKAHQHQL